MGSGREHRGGLLVPLSYVTAGVSMTAVCGGGVLAYALATWSQAHRAPIFAISLLAFVYAAIYASPWMKRALAGPHAGLLWLGWSIGLILPTGVIVVLDGGAGSPLVLVFATPLMFSALCYPPSLSAIVCAVDLTTCSVALTLKHAGFAYTELVLAILIGAAGMCIWHSRRQAAQHAVLDTLSRTDYLTGCLNRRGFEEAFARFVARHARYGRPFALLVFDLDDFKGVNDRDGHAAGDALLQWVAGQLRRELRSGDVLGRLGGDEFAVLAADVDGAPAHAALHRLNDAVQERTAMSGGLAECPVDGDDADALYRVADARLYEAKRAAREGRPRRPVVAA